MVSELIFVEFSCKMIYLVLFACHLVLITVSGLDTKEKKIKYRRYNLLSITKTSLEFCQLIKRFQIKLAFVSMNESKEYFFFSNKVVTLLILNYHICFDQLLHPPVFHFKISGPNRAFGDLIAASGITEGMIDSLILLKDVRDEPGLPPLRELEDSAIAKLHRTSSRTEIEKRLQEEHAKARVKQVDEKGRAYATGRRKCSIARVWIQPGSGKFLVNDKEFDVYFPILDHRAELLQPFSVTDTLGQWDVNCTVKGGGVSGQVGAIRLGISKALQNFEPAYHSYLKAVGYLTRDSRVVERKKPGKAKARKSFQWVKR